MAEYGGSVSSSMGGRSPALAALSAERKAAKTRALRDIAPGGHGNRFVLGTRYYVGGNARINFQLKTWTGDGYTSRPITAIEASQMEDAHPGIVAVVEKEEYSISGGPGRPRKRGLGKIEAHSIGRAYAPRASMIPTKEFKYVASEHGVSPHVINSIIRDVDVLAYRELAAAEEGHLYGNAKRNRLYPGGVSSAYLAGSTQDLARKAKGKAKRERVRAMYPGNDKYAETHREATAAATARFI